MLTNRQLFFAHLGQTSENPPAIEPVKAQGIYIYDNSGKDFIDLISGVSVSNVGHCRPEVVQAVKNQLDKYMHLMVYGEYIQCPQVEYAKYLVDLLPENLNSVYFVNSGSEAIEGALKLAKRYTGRHKIVALSGAYHGSTHGAMSLMSSDDFNFASRPLVPGIEFIDINSENSFDSIDSRTAAVVIEYIQAEHGIIEGKQSFFEKLFDHCRKNNVLIIADEVQTGFGRTGSLFAFEKYKLVPDILVLAKSMGAGMPVGAFVSDKKILDSFTNNPVLGHITTFGGHPVSLAAALAGLKVLIENKIVQDVNKKGEYLISQLKHPKITEIRGLGLFYAVTLENAEIMHLFLKKSIENGLLLDNFLFDSGSFRIAPPLTITYEEIDETCKRILKTLDECF